MLYIPLMQIYLLNLKIEVDRMFQKWTVELIWHTLKIQLRKD